MPRVATTDLIRNPKRYGYDVRIDTLLLRSAIGPGREMTIQSSDVQEGQINVKQNPEDFTSNLGRIYSRNNFSGGQGLDTAHRANGTEKDSTRFFDSKGVDVFHGDDETSYHIHLLYTTEEKTSALTLSAVGNNYMVRTQDSKLWLVDDKTVYNSTDGGANWSSSTTSTYEITGIVAYGNQVFITSGTGSTTELKHYDGSTWSVESLGTTITGYLTGIFFSKGVLYISGVTTDDIHYLWYADPIQKNFNNQFTSGSSNLLISAENLFTSVADAGAATLIANENGTIYSIKDVSGTPTLQGQTEIPFEEIHTISAAEGIVFFGTKEFSRDVGRLYRADLTVADNLYVLANRQLIKEWVIYDTDGVTLIDTTPHSIFVSRDSVYLGIKESASTSYLWRYYLPTAGLARDLEVNAGGLVYGITQYNGKFLISVAGAGVYKETSTYESTGYIITSAADFFTAESKQFVGAEVSTFNMLGNINVELRYSTSFQDLDDPGSSNYLLALKQNTGTGDTEKQISPVARYIIGKLVLNSSDGLNTPKVKSVQFRALARPELVVAQIPINISDRVERPGRKPIKVKNLGDALYQRLRQLEGNSVTLELYDPDEIIRGVVERISYPIQSNTEKGSVTQYAILTVRGTRQPTLQDVSSTIAFGIGKLGEVRFGG